MSDPPLALKQRAERDTPLMADLEELCNRIGGRITGSPGAERAVGWAMEKLRALRLDAVTTESYPLPFLWLPGTVAVAATAPEPFRIRAVAVPGTGSTGTTIETRVVDVGEGIASDWASTGPSAAGAIALVHTKEIRTLDDLVARATSAGTLLRAAAQAGVAGLLVQSSWPRGLLSQDPMVLGRTPGNVPAVLVSREHANRLARLLGKTEVRVRMDVVNRLGPSYEGLNVVGEIRGRETPLEVVVLGAHLDSWGLGTGAEDDGVNAALVIDVARAFRELDLHPRRTVRFVLFTGNEQGMWGSAGYVERHRAELDRHVGVVIFDLGSGHTRGFFLSGRPELRRFLSRALSVFPEVATSLQSTAVAEHTDNLDFLLSGVPNFVADQDPLPYLTDHHAESDVLERVNEREARRNSALAATLVFALASAREPPGRRLNRAQVEALLVRTRLGEQMQALEQWEDWKSGRRGFPRER